jgi:hypothetical protein
VEPGQAIGTPLAALPRVDKLARDDAPLPVDIDSPTIEFTEAFSGFRAPYHLNQGVASSTHPEPSERGSSPAPRTRLAEVFAIIEIALAGLNVAVTVSGPTSRPKRRHALQSPA